MIKKAIVQRSEGKLKICSNYFHCFYLSTGADGRPRRLSSGVDDFLQV